MPYPNKFNKNNKKKPKRVFTRRNRNQWFFEHSDKMCEEIYNMGKIYMETMNDPKKRPKRHMKYPAQLTKYFFFLYLTGARAKEPILSLNLELQVRSEKDMNYIYVKQINEKHFDNNNNRIETEVAIPIFCEHERLMWKYITNSGKDMNTKHIFEFEAWAIKKNKKGVVRQDNLTRYISNFRTGLWDLQGNLHKNERISPHILRHSRAFSMLVNHQAPIPLILGIMRWNSNQMLFYYTYLKRSMKFGNMLKMIKDSGYLDKKFNLELPESRAMLQPMYIVPQ